MPEHLRAQQPEQSNDYFWFSSLFQLNKFRWHNYCATESVAKERNNWKLIDTDIHGVVSSIEKIVRHSKQLVKVGSSQLSAKQLKQQVGIKPTLAYCLDGLRLLEEMHQSE
ncbi:hypothetical protein OROMI_013164 [Orobanche minor]